MRYRAGSLERNFLEQVSPYLKTSLLYLCSGSLIGLFAGIIGGFLLYRRYNGFPRDLISFFNSIPDFLLIISTQLLVVTVTRLTGVRLASISSYGSNSPLLLLPLLALSLYSLIVLPGMTRFLFRYGFQIYRPDALASYQYFLVVDCLVVLIGIYLVFIALLRLVLVLLGRYSQ